MYGISKSIIPLSSSVSKFLEVGFFNCFSHENIKKTSSKEGHFSKIGKKIPYCPEGRMAKIWPFNHLSLYLGCLNVNNAKFTIGNTVSIKTLKVRKVFCPLLTLFPCLAVSWLGLSLSKNCLLDIFERNGVGHGVDMK